jgi:DNA replication ATP-dependent helicase Dna2
MPLELKTGRSSFSSEHKGQVTLYSMMMTQAKGSKKTVTSPGGLLLYLQDCSIQQIPAGHKEQQGLIQLRNEMANYLTMPTKKNAQGKLIQGDLPPRIDRLNLCKTCPLAVECNIYQVLYFKHNVT